MIDSLEKNTTEGLQNKTLAKINSSILSQKK